MHTRISCLSGALLFCVSACLDARAIPHEYAGIDAGPDVTESDAEAEASVDPCAPTAWADVAEPDPERGDAFSVTVLEHGIPITNISVDFDSEARQTDRHGFVESSSAPRALTIRRFGFHGDPFNTPGVRPSWSSVSRLTVLAPQLGDTLVIDLTTFGRPGTQQTPFAVHVPTLPDVQGPVDVTLVAGERGCAREPTKGSKVGETVRLIVPDDCTSWSNNDLVAVARQGDQTYGVATVAVPTFNDRESSASEGDAGVGDASVPTIQVEPWLELEPLTVTYSAPPGSEDPAQVTLEMQRQKSWIPLGTKPLSESGEATFQVARSITDSFRASISRGDSWLMEGHPASATSIAIDDGPPLPQVTSLEPPAEACGEDGSLRWRLRDPEPHADAVILSLSKTEIPTSCCWDDVSWTLIAPPETRALPASFLDKFKLNRITYVDVERVEGYRDFLKLPLAPSATGLDTDDLPDDRRVRWRTFRAPAP